MNTIVYVGMDVHKDNFTLCCYSYETDTVQYKQTIPADYRLVLKYIANMRKHYPHDAEFICGYEAGCLGYSLYNQLRDHNQECIILAPTTMAITNTSHIKTDKRDAANIARCLAFHTYSAVYVPTKEDVEIKNYLRMRDDHKLSLKKIKQQMLAFVLRSGEHYSGTKKHWTTTHLKWLKDLELPALERETLDEYLCTYEYLVDKIERMDKRIEELAYGEKYAEDVKKLICFMGIKEHTALAIITEISDFRRFHKAGNFAAFLGLVPGENSSGNDRNQLGITKAGNGHLRRLLVESAQAYTRGAVGHKSIDLKKRQLGNPPNVIAYADKANERLRRRFYKLTLQGNVPRNKATTAIARELACFIWGMMTDHAA